VSGICFIERPSEEAVGREAAETVEKTLKQKPNASIVFPTGNTPLRMYQALRRTPYSLWSQARLFHLDEYVPPEGYQGPIKYETYEEYMRRELFDCVGGQKYYMRHYLNRLDEYERLISQDDGPDLVILGIGGNGHIAFNEPGSPQNAPTRIITLEAQTIRDNFGATGKRGYPTQAATLGLDIILRARHIMLLAVGHKKQAIIRKAFDPKNPPSSDCPASWLKEHPHVTVITDFRVSFQ
jgi:glucosamine-6-phosphate deaminase